MVFVRPSYSSRRNTTNTVNFYAPDYYTFEKDPKSGKRIIQGHYNKSYVRNPATLITTEIERNDFRFFKLGSFHFNQNCIESFTFQSEIPAEIITYMETIKKPDPENNEIIIIFDPNFRKEFIDFIIKIEALSSNFESHTLNMYLELKKNGELLAYNFKNVTYTNSDKYNLKCCFGYVEKEFIPYNL